MQFMLLMIPKGYETAKPGTVPDAERVAEMMKFNQALKDAGVLVTLNGLHPVSAGARVSFAGGRPTVIDGPFVETKETLGGYWIIRVKSRDEAIEWAKRCPATENETIEIRQVQEMEDFPADVQKAAEGFTALQHAAGQYVDGFVLPVPKSKVEDYRRVAAHAGNVWREYGALAFVECLADDVKPGKLDLVPAGREPRARRDGRVLVHRLSVARGARPHQRARHEGSAHRHESGQHAVRRQAHDLGRVQRARRSVRENRQ